MSSRGRGRGGLSGGIQFIKSKDVLNPSTEVKTETGRTEASEAKCFPTHGGFDSEDLREERNDSRFGVNVPKSLLSLPTAPSRNFRDNDSGRGRGGGRGGGGFGGGSFNRNDRSQSSWDGRNNTPASRNDRSQLSRDQYFRLWKSEKDSSVAKFRKLAHEIVSLSTARPNACDKIMSACNRVPMRVEFNTEPMSQRQKSGASNFICYVYMDGVFVATGQGFKLKDAKLNAYEQALDCVMMEFLRVVKLDPIAKELHSSTRRFMDDPPQPSKVALPKNSSLIPPSRRINTESPGASGGGQQKFASSSMKRHVDNQSSSSGMKESNLDVASMKRRHNDYKPVEDFVIVEPLIPIPDCTPAHTMRRSADFNHMLLEYEFAFNKGGPNQLQCVCKLENVELANVAGPTKVDARNRAAEYALDKLRGSCWIIKTKQAVDSDEKVSKEEMLAEMNECSTEIKQDNVGHKLLSKMGWTGGGVGKDGTGIATPIELQSSMNRQGLGLSSSQGITDEFRRKVRELIEEYTSSGNQDDLVFNAEFRMEERMIIHDECRKMNLKSKSKGKGRNRYLVARRKRSAFELFDMIMASGGETKRYKIVPPRNHSRGYGGGGGAMPGPAPRNHGPQFGGGRNELSHQQQFGSGGQAGNKWRNPNAKLFGGGASGRSDNGFNQDGRNQFGNNSGGWDHDQGGGSPGQSFGGFNQRFRDDQNGFDSLDRNYWGSVGGGANNFGVGQDNFGRSQNNNFGGGQNNFRGEQDNFGRSQNNNFGGGQNKFGGQNHLDDWQNDRGGWQDNMGGAQNNFNQRQNNGQQNRQFQGSMGGFQSAGNLGGWGQR